MIKLNREYHNLCINVKCKLEHYVHNGNNVVRVPACSHIYGPVRAVTTIELRLSVSRQVIDFADALFTGTRVIGCVLDTLTDLDATAEPIYRDYRQSRLIHVTRIDVNCYQIGSPQNPT